MEIKYPEIKRTNGYLSEYKILIGNFCDQYNDGKPNREHLKTAHINLYHELVFYAMIVIARDAKMLLAEDEQLCTVDSKHYVRVNLNRFREANKTRCHPDTIKRYKKRLIEAGVIFASSEKFREFKVPKTHRSDVLINPDLLLIYDRFNKDYQPESEFLTATQIQELREMKRANYIGVSSTVTKLESSNNVIRDVDNVDKGISHPVDDLQKNKNIPEQEATPKQLAETLENKPIAAENEPKCEKNTHALAGNKEQEVPAGAESPEKTQKSTQATDNLTEMKRNFAIELYIYLVEILFKYHNIYPAEATKTINYISNTYFSTLQSENHGKAMLKAYRWRVDAAAAYNVQHKVDFSNVYPSRYMNVNYQYGFVHTKAWRDKNLNDRRVKEERDRKNQIVLAEKLAFEQAVKQYKSNATPKQYVELQAWFSDKYPHRLNDFANFVSLYHS